MNKSQRIYLNSGDTITNRHIKINLEQETETLEFLSMSINTEDVYRSFNGDYGVLIGKVRANENIGVPNAKISIFIPLTEDDANDSQIKSIYPYKTPRDKNSNGKRYNLLPRVGRLSNVTGTVTPKQPFGSFPIKEEIVTNINFLNVYQKYYKYTTITNSVGDYMIFGVPIGTQIVHMSVDITDIDKYSMTPASMINNLGYSPNLFDKDGLTIKPHIDLNDLPHIETQEITVDVIPFWGDAENFEIGITRQDFRIRAQLATNFTIFGSVFTDSQETSYGENIHGGGQQGKELYRISDNAWDNVGISGKRIGKITEKIYYYPETITDEEIDSGDDLTDQMLVLDPTEYSIYKDNGVFVFIINCNRNKIRIDDNGNEIPFDGTGGIYSSFRGFMTLEYTGEEISLGHKTYIGDGNNGLVYQIRHKLKFPQSAEYGDSFTEYDNVAWKKEDMIFKYGTIYSVAKFHGIVKNDTIKNNPHNSVFNTFFDDDVVNNAAQGSYLYNVGVIEPGHDYTDIPWNSINNDPNNEVGGNSVYLFGATWLNFNIHLMQNGWLNPNDWNNVGDMVANTSMTAPAYNNTFFFENNNQTIAAGITNTANYARSDLHPTKFIEVTPKDINLLKTMGATRKGMVLTPSQLNGSYCNGNSTKTPVDGGRINGNPTATQHDENIYISLGIKTANCIDYLTSLGLGA